ncbi:hypothetical protein [Merismopedia glauca]|uniref:Uncharacterized protein n=1 Tax=Merismopedia glauca CCAP 1448/3 TaxID=1296344 RepID=A0A2T1BX30_9CYAN|nr:hypothetical protein [Merismopedia glauca]PSB00467.1 hypothetical protein C7B64_23330 [Merismopedia glauca CCAP 1448/3]
MPPIQQLNRLEKKLNSFGIRIKPQQTSKGLVTLPVRYMKGSSSAELTCIGGRSTESWRGLWSPTVQQRIKEHFEAFLAVDAL